MTAEEIRRYSEEISERLPPFEDGLPLPALLRNRHGDWLQGTLLLEIAAQLAELNAHFRRKEGIE